MTAEWVPVTLMGDLDLFLAHGLGLAQSWLLGASWGVNQQMKIHSLSVSLSKISK